MPDYDQLSLFPGSEDREPDLASTLDAGTVLEDASLIFADHLKQQGMSNYTVKAFRSDLNILIEWAGPDQAISSLGTASLNEFLTWMERDRGVPCSPKTYARRVTTLKSFFSFLHDRGVLKNDPAAALIQVSVRTPVPVILEDRELRAVLRAAGANRYDPGKPDIRPHFLLTLLLETAMKKSEVMALTLEDVIRNGDGEPYIWVRTKGPQNIYKERKIPISEELFEAFQEYASQREILDKVFDCTARNLEYVLRDLAERAAIDPLRKLSFEALRWTAAFADFRSGMPDDKLREKLGVSKITWRETKAKLLKLSE